MKIFRYLEDQILALLQRRCTHPGEMVAHDILEGCSQDFRIAYCRRCGTLYPHHLKTDGTERPWSSRSPDL